VPVDQINYNAHVIKLDNEYEIKKELYNIKADKRAYDLLIQKMVFTHIKLEQVDTRAANIIKQEIHALGGEAAISQEAYSFTERNTDIIISGSKKCMKILSRRISAQQYGLSEISKEIEKCISSNIGVMKINDRILDFKHKTYVSGVVSYYKYSTFSSFSEKRMLKKVELMIKAGADIINVSSENFSSNGEDELVDISSLTHFIKEIKRQFPGVLTSIDTSRLIIAKEAINSGIDIINKTAPLKFNEDLINLIAQEKCPIIMIFSPNGSHPKPLVSISDVIKDIQSNVNYAIGKGIDKDKIIIDPGIGFGRSDKDNFLILKQLSSFKHLNLPIIVGLSKRSFLGDALRGKMKQTHISTIAANTLAIINGVNIIRVYTAEHVSMMANIIDSIMRVDDMLL
jgi:dihydropteroate synthase